MAGNNNGVSANKDSGTGSEANLIDRALEERELCTLHSDVMKTS